MPQNDPSLHPANLSSDITNFLKENKVTEAASHAIAVLSADVDDKVGAGLYLLPKLRNSHFYSAGRTTVPLHLRTLARTCAHLLTPHPVLNRLKKKMY